MSSEEDRAKEILKGFKLYPLSDMGQISLLATTLNSTQLCIIASYVYSGVNLD